MSRRTLGALLLIAGVAAGVQPVRSGFVQSTTDGPNVITSATFTSCGVPSFAALAGGGGDWRTAGDGGSASAAQVAQTTRTWTAGSSVWLLQGAAQTLRRITSPSGTPALSSPIVGSRTGTTTLSVGSALSTADLSGAFDGAVDAYDASRMWLLTSTQIVRFAISTGVVDVVYSRTFTTGGTTYTAQRIESIQGSALSTVDNDSTHPILLASASNGHAPVLQRTGAASANLITAATADATAISSGVSLTGVRNRLAIATATTVSEISPILGLSLTPLVQLSGLGSGFAITDVTTVPLTGLGLSRTFYFTGADTTTPRRNNVVWSATSPALSLVTVAATVVAGSATADWAFADGTATAARFATPTDIVNDGTYLYVLDSRNQQVRKILITSGTVSGVAGNTTPPNVADTNVSGSQLGAFAGPGVRLHASDAALSPNGSFDMLLHNGRVMADENGAGGRGATFYLYTTGNPSPDNSVFTQYDGQGETSIEQVASLGTFVSGSDGLFLYTGTNKQPSRISASSATTPVIADTGTSISTTASSNIGGHLGRLTDSSLGVELTNAGGYYLATLTSTGGMWTRVAGTTTGTGITLADGVTATSALIGSPIVGLGQLQQGTTVFGTSGGVWEILRNGKLDQMVGGGASAPATGVNLGSVDLTNLTDLSVSPDGDVMMSVTVSGVNRLFYVATGSPSLQEITTAVGGVRTGWKGNTCGAYKVSPNFDGDGSVQVG